MPVVRLSAGIRAADNDLQSLCALGGTRDLGAAIPWTCCAWSIDGDADDRCHPRQGASLGFGRKKGEQNQAIGRSRGGRNTKIHAIADAKGRLLAVLLTGGQAHDCPPAQRLIRRAKAARKMLGDKAYDSAELRQWLSERGTKPVVPNKSNRKQPFSFDRKSYKQRHRIENAFCRLKDFRRIATRYDRLARNFLASVCLVAAIVWWILWVWTLVSDFGSERTGFRHFADHRRTEGQENFNPQLAGGACKAELWLWHMAWLQTQFMRLDGDEHSVWVPLNKKGRCLRAAFSTWVAISVADANAPHDALTKAIYDDSAPDIAIWSTVVDRKSNGDAESANKRGSGARDICLSAGA
jgi:transposase